MIPSRESVDLRARKGRFSRLQAKPSREEKAREGITNGREHSKEQRSYQQNVESNSDRFEHRTQKKRPPLRLTLPRRPAEEHARIRKTGRSTQETGARPDTPSPAAAPAAPGAPPVGVDLAGEALLSEEGLRLAQTRHLVWMLACNLALEAEEHDQQASGRSPEEMCASAKCFASHVAGLLAASSAPYAAMTDFVYWIRRRAYRSARRAKKTGA